MIVPDVNLLLHAYDANSLVHGEARAWWEDRLGGAESVGLAWVTVLGFIRIATTLRTAARPLHVREACDHARSWLSRPHVSIVEPGGCFGEMGPLDGSPRSGTAHVVEDSLLLYIDKLKLHGLIRSYPELALGLLHGMSARVRETSEKLRTARDGGRRFSDSGTRGED